MTPQRWLTPQRKLTQQRWLTREVAGPLFPPDEVPSRCAVNGLGGNDVVPLAESTATPTSCHPAAFAAIAPGPRPGATVVPNIWRGAHLLRGR